MRFFAFALLLFTCVYLSMREASLYYPELTTMLPLTSPEGIIEQVLNFTAILLSAAGAIIACISSPGPKQRKEKTVQKPTIKLKVKQKKTTSKKRSKKVKPKSSGDPFKTFFGDTKEKQK